MLRDPLVQEFMYSEEDKYCDICGDDLIQYIDDVRCDTKRKAMMVFHFEKKCPRWKPVRFWDIVMRKTTEHHYNSGFENAE